MPTVEEIVEDCLVLMAETLGDNEFECSGTNLLRLIAKYIPRWEAGDTVSFAKPMEDAQSREFGSKTLSYGKYKGRRIDDVPLSYIKWMADHHGLGLKMWAYMKSPRIQKEFDEDCQRRRGRYFTDDEDMDE